MSLLERFLRRQPSSAVPTYREPAAEDPVAVVADRLRSQALRVRALERQLAAAGIRPAHTPDGRELAAVAEILDSIARCEGVPSKYNTLDLAQLAACMRGLAEWIE